MIRVNHNRLLVDRLLKRRRHLEVGGPIYELALKIAEHDEHKNGKQSTQAQQATSGDHPPKANIGGLHIAITAISAICSVITTAVGVPIGVALIG